MATLSREEATLYDRQIRLWGAEAQRRLMGGSVLLVGMNGVHVEVAKNLVLGGVRNLAIHDGRAVSDEAIAANFLIGALAKRAKLSVAAASAPALDGMSAAGGKVRVVDSGGDVDWDELVASVDLVSVQSADRGQWTAAARAARAQAKPVFVGASAGSSAFFLNDLGAYEYLEDVPESELVAVVDDDDSAPDTVRVVSLDSPRLDDVLRSPSACLGWAKVPEPARALFDGDGLESRDQVHVCAVAGGVLAQEMIRVLTRKERPLQNFFHFDSDASRGIIVLLQPNNCPTKHTKQEQQQQQEQYEVLSD